MKDVSITVGSVESGDLMVVISESPSKKLEIDIKSKFLKQYKDEINAIILEVCKEKNVTDLKLEINDQGAIPAVIRARVLAAIEKWGK
ncbi:citrate lyase subunit gamma (acyl carrier protein) [Spiroplasma helicoides]|uniref:Citrate lyase subunit gamma (Acyl carrier protein) n=1 Tax=Spiroplasma helicoides TaxID=216938 RepID=A0A1B3SM26_9MOLU|nr:citrate lyase acyl carrier protein [Spiroplasma helicoides]AOG60985.1 citrate lyase subunit gamma (acyl carrier protein) [Spiroplasma helicoides]